MIDLEGDDDLLVLGETSRKSTRNKGKAVETNHGGYGDHQVVVSITFCSRLILPFPTFKRL
jgi:hypothetical protein